MKTTVIIILCFGCLSLIGCKDECSSYSGYSCEEIQQATYNTYFYFPDSDKEYFLGVSNGLDECGSLASEYASSEGMGNNTDWSYICCMKTEDSECKEKHR